MTSLKTKKKCCCCKKKCCCCCKKKPLCSGTTIEPVEIYTGAEIYKQILYQNNNEINHNNRPLNIPPGASGFYLSSNPDLTHGITNYVDKNDKTYLEKYVTLDGDKLKLQVEKLQPVENTPRSVKSVRLESYKEYNSGIFVFSASHCPTGDGIWPAFWLVGSNWPANGEIDILEAVNSEGDAKFGGERCRGLYNISTLHTPNNGSCKLCINGKCQPCDQGFGCPQNFSGNFTVGKEFNNNGGGVYVCQLSKEKVIKIWFFQKKNIPNKLKVDNTEAITAEDITTWSKTDGYVQFDACQDYFNNLFITLNIAVCGDWPNQGYSDNMYNNQETVNAINNSNGISENAYFIVDYIKIYPTPDTPEPDKPKPDKPCPSKTNSSPEICKTCDGST
jgi:hypothetical protein